MEVVLILFNSYVDNMLVVESKNNKRLKANLINPLFDSNSNLCLNFQGDKMAEGKKPEEGTEALRKSSEVDTEEECCDSLYRWANDMTERHEECYDPLYW